MTKRESRISILDGFRTIAIISVILYHYFSRWTPPIHATSLYPYGSNYNYFGWGKFGVQLFFIISGFVICFTLEKTESMASFWKKRMIRLLPSIILASLFTFVFFLLFDKNNLFPDSHFIKNFIPSISFIRPSLFNNIFNTNLGYINSSYWSLWPEMQFYFLSSCIYFFNKKRFIENFMAISVVLISINHLIQNIQASNKLNIELPEAILTQYNLWISNGFNLINYLPFFCFGTFVYALHKKKKEGTKTSLVLKLGISFIILITICFESRMHIRLVYILIISLFFIFIFYPQKLSFLENEKITTIGESSYFLYLIHEQIGVLTIYMLGHFFLPDSFIIPVILIIGLTWLSVLFTKKIDKPINKLLRKAMTRSIRKECF